MPSSGSDLELSCRHSNVDRSVRNVAGYHSPCSDHRHFSDTNAWQQGGVSTYSRTLSDNRSNKPRFLEHHVFVIQQNSPGAEEDSAMDFRASRYVDSRLNRHIFSDVRFSIYHDASSDQGSLSNLHILPYHNIVPEFHLRPYLNLRIDHASPA